MRRLRGESGQVLAWGAGALAAAALLGLFAAREARLRWERLRARTAADATALAAGTAYARGLNIAAASNQLLFMAAAADAMLLLTGEGEMAKLAKVLRGAAGGRGPASLTEVVTGFQDAWAGTGGGPARPGLAVLSMGATARAVGAANGLAVLALWNPARSPVPAVPGLQVRRASAAEVAALFGGRRIPLGKEEDRRQYSHLDRSTGKRVIVSGKDVELITFRGPEGVRTQARMKQGAGKLAGRFLKTERVAGKVLKFLDIPAPLLERSSVHTVMVMARPVRGGAPVVAAVRVSGGAVFSAGFGDPSFDVRLIDESPATPFAPRWLDAAGLLR